MAKRAKLESSNGASADVDKSYFDSYADISIHEDMIGDEVRTNSYRLAILKCHDQIRGKVVADIGAGTGILSIFCAQAGARKVYAVEASSMAKRAAEVNVKKNGMEGVIQVIHGTVEDTELAEKVDLIVSEWMGYMLLYEGMLNSVVTARDKWLKPGGLLLPSTASLYLCPARTESDIHDQKQRFWEGVGQSYGVDMSQMVELSHRAIYSRVHTFCMEPYWLLAYQEKVAELDLATVTHQDLEQVVGSFSFKCFGVARVGAFVAWFTVSFPGRDRVTLSTSPFKHPTHWQQSVMYLRAPQEVLQDSVVQGSIALKQNPRYKRFLDILLKYSVDKQAEHSQEITLSDQQ